MQAVPPPSCRTRPRGRHALMMGLLLITACDLFHRWDGVVYRNRHDRGDVIELGTFASLEACRGAARIKMRELKIGELGGYVCGENCMVHAGFGPMRMCARTSQ
jgi:hypothetical protein